MSDPAQKVRVVLTATVYRGKKKVRAEKSTIHLTEDASFCLKSALHAFATALTAENAKTPNRSHD